MHILQFLLEKAFNLSKESKIHIFHFYFFICAPKSISSLSQYLGINFGFTAYYFRDSRWIGIKTMNTVKK